MEYTIQKLAQLARLSTRALRYYDEIGLLKPARINSSGYRIYGQKEVDRLQLILFFKELGFELDKIKKVIDDPHFNKEKMLMDHLAMLESRRHQIDLLINNVTNTLQAMKGEKTMSDKEKFEGFKQKLVSENEAKYGKEVREKYGEEAVNKSNQQVLNMTQEQYEEVQKLDSEIKEKLKLALELGDPASEPAQKACELHAQWLCYFWPKGTYSKEKHASLGQMYVDDERFKAYYDQIAPGCAEFFRDALAIYARK